MKTKRAAIASRWLAGWTAGAVTVVAPRQPARSVARFPVSILETIRPERLKASLEAGDDSLAARFLFAWPGPQPYRALSVLEASRDEEILQRLRALSRLARSADDPCVIDVDARGRAALDAVLAGLHDERRKVERLEAAWLGKSRSLIVRLAGVLELLATVDGKASVPARSAPSRSRPPRRCGATTSGRMPARCSTAPSSRTTPSACAVSPAGCWTKRPATVSREDIRRNVLSRSATADETQHVLERLHYLGYVQPDLAYADRGRPANRWLVNPALSAK